MAIAWGNTKKSVSGIAKAKLEKEPEAIEKGRQLAIQNNFTLPLNQ